MSNTATLNARTKTAAEELEGRIKCSGWIGSIRKKIPDMTAMHQSISCTVLVGNLKQDDLFKSQDLMATLEILNNRCINGTIAWSAFASKLGPLTECITTSKFREIIGLVEVSPADPTPTPVTLQAVVVEEPEPAPAVAQPAMPHLVVEPPPPTVAEALGTIDTVNGVKVQHGIKVPRLEVPEEATAVPAISNPSDPMSVMAESIGRYLGPLITCAAKAGDVQTIARIKPALDALAEAVEGIDRRVTAMPGKALSVAAVNPEDVARAVDEQFSSRADGELRKLVQGIAPSLFSEVLSKAADAVSSVTGKPDMEVRLTAAYQPQVDPAYAWTKQLTIMAQLIEKASDISPQNAVLVGPAGCGKCLATGTPVIMFDGSIKPVEQIKAGDLLMGPNGTSRIVTSTTSGREEMFMVTPVKGEPYTVNRSHILSLVNTSSDEVVNISINDYLAKSNTFKFMHKGWRSGFIPEFGNNLKPDADMPAYILGLWLGDGRKSGSSFSICKPDHEVLDALEKYASSIGLNVTVSSTAPSKCPEILVTARRGSGQKSRAMKALIRLGVHDAEPFVPDAYKLGSYRTRLDVIAGLLDSDGCLSHDGCTYDWISKSRRLADDLVFMCRSLGMAAYVKECSKSCQTGATGTYHRVSISGNATSLIPCRIARRKPGVRQQVKDVLRTGIKVESVGVGDYHGFTLSGPDHLFLLGDFTVTHNTEMAIQFAASNNRTIMIMDCANIREAREWFGTKGAANGATYFRKSQFWMAVEKGNAVILLDELNRLSPHVLNALMPLLDHRRQSYVEEVGETLKVGPRTVFFATMNEGLDYSGTHTMDRALKNRFPRRIELTFLPEDRELQVLLDKIPGLARPDAENFVSLANTIRAKATGFGGGLSETMSTRQLLAAAQDFVLGGTETFQSTVFNHFTAEGGTDSERAQVINMFQLKGYTFAD